ncbi:ankyrin repeat domain-containing protein [Pacificimonas sp. WHA3]|uniref:Ankyrin repeat domain-containing protein n=1 Tax=Pacificimonas pallii TaxID=2827236 RepID=A0ABS6SEX7_9SPHN|nr:ankyrin repeat domain-containing protein [Pacificimonas pallii]MBV7256962.1 ankyrin repeat domain-containing protein [Pacificimonas pallii]
MPNPVGIPLTIALALAGCSPEIDADMTTETSQAAAAARFSDRDRALAEAVFQGSAAEIAALVEAGGNPSAVNEEGKPLLLLPVEAGDVETFRALLAAGADPLRRLPNGQIPMQYAVQAAGTEFTAAMLDAGADPDARNGADEPMTYHAAMWNQWEDVKLLVEAGADLEAFVHGKYGDTLLGYYVGGQWDKAYWLLERGARPDYELKAAAPGQKHRIGTKPILEAIFWRDVDPGAFPELAEWQARAQALILERGYERPPEPERFREDRERRMRGG